MPGLLMAVGGTPVPIAMKRTSSTIPIVFGIDSDPVLAAFTAAAWIAAKSASSQPSMFVS